MTIPLADFLPLYEQNNIVWWNLSSGDHKNLFDEALERTTTKGDTMTAQVTIRLTMSQATTLRDLVEMELEATKSLYQLHPETDPTLQSLRSERMSELNQVLRSLR